VNIVFDFGRVVFLWDPTDYVANIFADPAARLKVRQAIFDHPDWQEIDRGTLTLKELTQRGVSRTGLPEADIRRMMEAVPTILTPIPETVDLIYRLKKGGHPLYALSNMGESAMAYLEKTHAFLKLFDGKVISSHIKLIKPDPAIFRYLLDRFNLDPQQTVFIDDHIPNIEAAAGFGIQTIHFTSPTQCEKELIRLGCL
jgi:putative hydrolase of the HAD superfamily